MGRGADGREPALAALPSATRFSRTSLLCGTLKDGGQHEERAGFTAFWRGRRSALFHKAGLGAGAGARLDARRARRRSRTPAPWSASCSTRSTTALRDDRQVSDQTWRLADVDYLPELLRAAAAAGRPVILTSDHGHVLDRGDDIHPATGESARYRTGTAGRGRAGLPRAPRAAPRRGGHHAVGRADPVPAPQGRATTAARRLAEMVIPVLVFVPSPSLCPKDWAVYETPSLHEPAWWSSAPEARTVTPVRRRRRGSTPRRPTARTSALFGAEEIDRRDPVSALAVVASEMFAGQRSFVRKAPEDAVVAALIDGLARAGGKLPDAGRRRR